eukprot:4467067-Prymnesium_polylepis.1
MNDPPIDTDTLPRVGIGSQMSADDGRGWPASLAVALVRALGAQWQYGSRTRGEDRWLAILRRTCSK